MTGLNPGLHNWGWGGQITLYALAMVFLMLLVLMLCLQGVTALDAKLAARELAEEAEEPDAVAPLLAAMAAVTAAGDLDEGELAALAIVVHQTVASGDTLQLAALGVTLETILSGSDSVPVLVANQSSAGLADSRWLAAGRTTQTQSWQRS